MVGHISMITLNDLLNFTDEEINNVKIRFNQSNGIVEPMELYQQNPELINTDYFLWRKEQRYFKEGQIAICLLKLTFDTWLLTTIKQITKDLNVIDNINYEAYEIEKYKKYYGRVILKFHKTFQSQGVLYANIHKDLIVNQILPTVFDGDDFPGYDKVRLTYNQLDSIISRGKRDWISALENQKAVYLITDINNGKLYVGSATNKTGMLLQRWRNYILNGHGGNRELIELVSKNGFEYIKNNFKYSILENYNSKVDDNIILERESWWKETLQSRKFGYNSN